MDAKNANKKEQKARLDTQKCINVKIAPIKKINGIFRRNEHLPLAPVISTPATCRGNRRNNSNRTERVCQAEQQTNQRSVESRREHRVQFYIWDVPVPALRGERIVVRVAQGHATFRF